VDLFRGSLKSNNDEIAARFAWSLVWEYRSFIFLAKITDTPRGNWGVYSALIPGMRSRGWNQVPGGGGHEVSCPWVWSLVRASRLDARVPDGAA
jgi:hypothetical protein